MKLSALNLSLTTLANQSLTTRDRHPVKINKQNCPKLDQFCQILRFFVFSLDCMPNPAYNFGKSVTDNQGSASSEN